MEGPNKSQRDSNSDTEIMTGVFSLITWRYMAKGII